MFRNLLRDCRLLSFLDSNTALGVCVSGYSRVAHSAALISTIWLLDAAGMTQSWFSRVPSESNIADGPSRLDVDGLVAQGAEVVKAVWPTWLDGASTANSLYQLKKVLGDARSVRK